MKKRKIIGKPDTVEAYPVKSFFVEMLTRDIELVDAVLDLLDNCVDGIVRQKINNEEQPYKGFYADISFDENHFKIEDNCGGIPRELSNYAFRMGRTNNNQDVGTHTVGTYGIGMKRAIFKIGKECEILTRCKNDNYAVNITPEWIADEKNWKLPRFKTEQLLKTDGTTIEINQLYSNIANSFKRKESFESDFASIVRRHYAIIIQKGFTVRVNKVRIEARPIRLLFENYDDPSDQKALIRPFIYKTSINNVEVFLAIGFTQPPPTNEELEKDAKEKQYSSRDAGWSIICNDRVVLSCDKSILTGWGEAGVPNYHTQFIAIAGYVEFRSTNARNLPMTTTKRGVDANSEIYLAVKNKMREGLKLFTDYTNKWKGREVEARKQLSSAKLVEAKKISLIAQVLTLTTVKKGGGGKQYSRPLPAPKTIQETQRISFIRKRTEIQKVAEYLFKDKSTSPTVVGEKCFDLIMDEAE